MNEPVAHKVQSTVILLSLSQLVIDLILFCLFVVSISLGCWTTEIHVSSQLYTFFDTNLCFSIRSPSSVSVNTGSVWSSYKLIKMLPTNHILLFYSNLLCCTPVEDIRQSRLFLFYIQSKHILFCHTWFYVGLSRHLI